MINKSKLKLICLIGTMAFALSACQNKSGAEGEKQISGTKAQSASESDESAEIGGSAGFDINNITRVSDREGYVGFQDLNIDDYVTLNDYKNMKVTAQMPATDDESIEEYINSSILKGLITDRAVKNGDVVNIDYEGKKDGVAFAGGTAQGTDLEIGSGSFIPGFEEGLIGVMPGETAALNLKFPDNYQSAELAGKEVVFTVKVNGIAYSAEYKDASQDDLERLGLPYGSKEELWEAAKAELEKKAEETFEANKTDAILNQILEESTIKSVPEYLVEEQIQSNVIYMETMARMYYNMSFEDYLKSSQMFVSLEDFKADIRPDSEEAVKRYLILEALARAEKIEITDDIIYEYAQKDIEALEGYTADKYIDEVGYTAYRMYVVNDKVGERLKSIINVEKGVE